MNISDYYVVICDSNESGPFFRTERVAEMLKRQRLMCSSRTQSNFSIFAFEESQEAAQTTLEKIRGNPHTLMPNPPGNQRSWSNGQLKTPLCPLCSKEMVKRKAKRGGLSGKEFWGCQDFPHCKGSRNI